MSTPTLETPEVSAFIALFQSLSEPDQFRLGALFNQATGGKLSPYNSPSPVAVAVVPVLTDNGYRVLGVRRAIEPNKGRLALPGGFVNPGEEPRAAAAREVLEETGLALDVESFFPQCDARAAGGNTTLLFYIYSGTATVAQFEAACERLAEQGDGEAFELVLLDSSDTLGFPLHQEALLRALGKHR